MLEMATKTAKYKTLASLFAQMRPPAEKTMANCRKSAHAAPMSEKNHVFARRYAGLWT
jgi:hypothetical protein